jgi:hypothetical protein
MNDLFYKELNDGGATIHINKEIVNLVGKENLLKGEIAIDEEGRLVIIPQKDLARSQDIRSKTRKLMEKYNNDLKLMKD